MAMTGMTADALPASTRERAIGAARRHSGVVRLLRVALPVSAVLVLAGIVASIVSDPRVLLATQLDAAQVGVSGSRIVMQRPRLTGYSSPRSGESRPYEIVAERAEQSVAEPNEVNLFELKARMGMREDGWAELLAASGHMNSNTQILELYDTIDVTTDLNDRARMSEAVINFGKGELVSPAPVDIKLGQTTITADRMELFETGQRAVFTGRVRMTLHPKTASENGVAQ